MHTYRALKHCGMPEFSERNDRVRENSNITFKISLGLFIVEEKYTSEQYMIISAAI